MKLINHGVCIKPAPIKKLCLLFTLCAVLSACGKLIAPKLSSEVQALRGGEYSADPAHSVILFKIDHLGYAKYVGRFNRFQASLNFSAENIEQARLSAQVEMASVDVNDEKLEQRLRGRGWFNVAEYPVAEFETSSAKLIDHNVALFAGTMTFLGVSAPIEVEVEFNGGGTNVLTGKYTIGFAAQSRFLRSTYGLDKFIPAIGDEVFLEIHAEFQRQYR